MIKKGIKKVKLDDLLLTCQRAIEDAIGCEDGLDGAIGEDILKMIRKYRKENKMEIYKSPKL